MSLWPFFHKPEPVVADLSDVPGRLRGKFTTSPRERRRRSNEATVLMELGILTAGLSDAERHAAIARAATMPLEALEAQRIASRFAPEKGRAVA